MNYIESPLSKKNLCEMCLGSPAVVGKLETMTHKDLKFKLCNSCREIYDKEEGLNG